MAMTVSELQVKVSADTSDVERGLSSLGSKLGSVGGTLATAFGGAAIAGLAGLTAGLGASVVAAAGFEAQMSAISAVSGATASEMEALSAQALQLGADTSFSASEAAAGMNELIRAGVSIGDVLGGGAAAALNLAAAGGLEVAEAAEIASNAMNVFGISGSQVGHVADVIAGAANASAIDVHDFGMSLSAAGAVAATVGIGFDDLGAAIAVMGQSGIKGSDAGTSLKTMLLNLSPATDKARGVMEQLGIITAEGGNRFFDAGGKARSLAEISGVLQEATSGLTEQQRIQALQTIFGTDAIRAAAIMAEAGSEGFAEMATSIGKVTAAAVAAERLNNLKGDVEQLTGSIETAAIKIGTALLPTLRAITQGVTGMVNESAPALEEFATEAVILFDNASVQITDAWTTAKQAFAGDWLPSDDIPPFVNAVGTISTAIGQLATKAEALGTMDALNRGLESLKANSSGIATNIQGLSEALGRLSGSAGTAEQKLDLLAAAARTVAAGFENAVAVTSIAIDSIVQMGRTFVDFQTIMLNTGRALFAWATGNEEAYQTATQASASAFLDMITSTEAWATRTATAGQGVGSALQGVGVAAGVLSSEVGTATAAAAASAETNMAVVATASETNMAAATAAVEAAGPQMAAAAESAASGAVAAVEGQAGAASAAGASVGDSIGSGMLSGIRSWVGSIASAAASLVSSAIGAARAEADARSPSKKTQKLGEDMAEGLEIGLSKSGLGEEMQAKIRAFIEASRAYIPVAGQIKRVEDEIATIREQSQTDALFRAERMITIDSEVLRLKQAQVSLERDLVPLRQDLARATREVTDIERGSLADRTRLIEMDGQRKTLRLQEIELEKQLIGLDSGSKKAQSIQKQLDKLRDTDRALGLEAEKTRLTQDVAATAGRVKREVLDDQARGQETVVQLIKDQIETLGAEQAAFSANEAVIKNATDNEIAYRNRLIAVFTAEGKPLADRITAGKLLLEQLKAEGKISDELYNAVRKVTDEMGDAKGATAGLGTASATATPQMDAAAKKAEEMARQAKKVADEAKGAGKEVDALSRSLGKLPDWFTPKKSGGDALGFGSNSADGGHATSGTILPAVSSMQTMAGNGGGTQTVRVVLEWPDGRAAGEIVVRGLEDGQKRGRVRSGLLA